MLGLHEWPHLRRQCLLGDTGHQNFLHAFDHTEEIMYLQVQQRAATRQDFPRRSGGQSVVGQVSGAKPLSPGNAENAQAGDADDSQ